MSRIKHMEVRNIYRRLLTLAQDAEYDVNGGLTPDNPRQYENSHSLARLHHALHDIFAHRNPSHVRPQKPLDQAIDNARAVLWPTGTPSSLTAGEQTALIYSLAFIVAAHVPNPDGSGDQSAKQAAPYGNQSVGGY